MSLSSSDNGSSNNPKNGLYAAEQEFISISCA